jgi:hypothetical protein
MMLWKSEPWSKKNMGAGTIRSGVSSGVGMSNREGVFGPGIASSSSAQEKSWMGK